MHREDRDLLYILLYLLARRRSDFDTGGTESFRDVRFRDRFEDGSNESKASCGAEDLYEQTYL